MYGMYCELKSLQAENVKSLEHFFSTQVIL